MAKKHQVQHKERREEAKGKELADIKRENSQLKRQVARLTKQLTRALDTQSNDTDDKNVREHVESQRKAAKCEQCPSLNLKSVKIPGGTLVVCKDCGWRKKT